MQSKYTISEELKESVTHFFKVHDIPVFKEGLRRIFMEYLEEELKTGLCDFVAEMFWPFNSLLDVLDEAAKEYQEYNFTNRLNEQSKLQPRTTNDKVIAFLAASLTPSAIFLLHHNTTGNNKQHFDLLVVIPPTSKTSFTYYEQVITMANIDDAVINVSLHKEEVIQQQLKEGHIYYSIACIKENLVYSNKAFELPATGKDTLLTLAEKATAIFKEAQTKADNFLHGAANFRGDRNNELAAFMLQQATELLLRGLINALLGSCAKTHSFKELKKPLQRCADEIAFLLSKDADEESRLLALLEKAYIESRYSNQLIISDKDLDVLSEGAEKLYDYVQEVFEKKMKKLV